MILIRLIYPYLNKRVNWVFRSRKLLVGMWRRCSIYWVCSRWSGNWCGDTLCNLSVKGMGAADAIGLITSIGYAGVVVG
eukprot:scaffold8452_cov185-Ochromonas_danica.AAC.21